MRISLDVTRTLAHRFNPTPTGIDRVEHAYIRWLLNEGEAQFPYARFIISTPIVHAALTRYEMAKILSEIESLWIREYTSHGGSLYTDLCTALEQPISQDPTAVGIRRFRGQEQKQSKRRAYTAIAALCARHALAFRTFVSEARSFPTIYLHSSHTQLDEPKLFAWTEAPGIHPAFFIHDLIPIDYPEFCGDTSDVKHKIRMRTVATRAHAILTNSDYTRERIEHYFTTQGLAIAPIGMTHLGNTIQEYNQSELDLPRAKVPYFVCLGTIEGRKNIAHLLNVWRDILSVHGPENTPRLVIVGRRGWRCQDVLATLDRSVQLAGAVLEVSGLKDVELASLLHGAAALIAPSLVEGYGLPPVEAVRRGIPVIASDIPAHREVLGESALFVGPSDGLALRDAVMAIVHDPEFRRQRIEATLALPPISWTAFVEDNLGQLLDILSRRKEQH